jgi:HD-GYP domain-containing protein (c-di-GMP phosphodiesterase class II)
MAMKVVPVAATALRVGRPVPFALRDSNGAMLLAAGAVIATEGMRQQLVDRGIFVDIVDSENFQRALAGKVDSMLRQNASIGQIAQAKVDAREVATDAPAMVAVRPNPMRRPTDPVAAWQSLVLRAGSLLHEPSAQDFCARTVQLDQDIQALVQTDPDGSLLVLIQNAGAELHQYSAGHAVLVSVMVGLAARQLSEWPEDWGVPLRCAALTMNLAMTALQNQLALQDSGLSPRQRAHVDGHAEAGTSQLVALGVDDPLWLEAVAHHHAGPPGPMSGLPPGQRLGRLIQRADIFAARLSPRRVRAAQSATAAAKAAYLDEHQQPDEAGAAIIKALGVYPPGSFVQLASNELGVVLRRGPRSAEPLVASVISRNGTPMGEPAVRDTRLKAHEVMAGVAPKEVRVRVPLARLLQLAG